MVNVRDVCNALNEIAPFYMKMDFDNIGLLTGFPDRPVTKILTALDVTDAVIEEAISVGAELIVAHHPLIFHPLKAVTADESHGRKIIRMVKHDLSAICIHTNLDSADGGVNDALMEALGGSVTGLLAPHGVHPDGRPYGIARLGELPEALPLEDFLRRVKTVLNCNGLRYVAGNRPVRKLACCGGAGGSELEAVLAAGCDTYVTADLKYDQYLTAKEAGLNLIDADHFCTENVVVPRLKAMLEARFPALEIRVSRVHEQTVQSF